MDTSSDDAPNPWWDPMGMWQRTGSAFADLSKDQPIRMPGSWNAIQAVFDAVRSGLVGRPIALGSAENRVAFTLTSLEGSVSHMAAASGQVDDVSLGAEDVTWRRFHFVKVAARLGNVHTRFRSRPMLVSAPIDVSAEMTGEALDAVLSEVSPTFRCEITDAGDLRLRGARRPGWGYVQVVPVVEHGALVLRPTGVGRGVRRVSLGRRVLPIRPRLDLPSSVRLTGLDLRAGSLNVHLRIDEWRVDSLELLSLARKHPRPEDRA